MIFFLITLMLLVANLAIIKCSSDINATYFPVSDFTLTVAFSLNPYKLR